MDFFGLGSWAWRTEIQALGGPSRAARSPWSLRTCIRTVWVQLVEEKATETLLKPADIVPKPTYNAFKPTDIVFKPTGALFESTGAVFETTGSVFKLLSS